MHLSQAKIQNAVENKLKLIDKRLKKKTLSPSAYKKEISELTQWEEEQKKILTEAQIKEKAKQTPRLLSELNSSSLNYDRFRSCVGKKCHVTFSAARNTLKRYNGDKMHVYECDHCYFWHVGHMRQKTN